MYLVYRRRKAPLVPVRSMPGVDSERKDQQFITDIRLFSDVDMIPAGFSVDKGNVREGASGSGLVEMDTDR